MLGYTVLGDDVHTFIQLFHFQTLETKLLLGFMICWTIHKHHTVSSSQFAYCTSFG